MDHRAKSIKALIIFTSVALGLSVLHWLLFYPATAELIGWHPPSDIFNLLRSFGPTAAAVIAAAYLGGRSEIREILSRTFRWRIPVSNYLIALLGPLLAICFVSIVVYFVSPAAFEPGDINILKLVAIFFVLPFVDGPLGEEIGWRGFFLPELLKHYSSFVASIIVGVVWYLWHLPIYYADGQELGFAFLLKYFLFVISLSFLHTWLFIRSGYSTFLSIMFHNMTNYVVLLSFTVFPGLLKIELDDDIYIILAVVLGIVTAISLVRKKNTMLNN